jgi:hypothetical protein
MEQALGNVRNVKILCVGMEGVIIQRLLDDVQCQTVTHDALITSSNYY